MLQNVGREGSKVVDQALEEGEPVCAGVLAAEVVGPECLCVFVGEGHSGVSAHIAARHSEPLGQLANLLHDLHANQLQFLPDDVIVGNILELFPAVHVRQRLVVVLQLVPQLRVRVAKARS